MLIGQSVYAPVSGTTYYGPWIPRQGDAFTVVVEVIDAMTPFSLQVQAQTKNREDVDPSAGTVLSGSTTLTGATTQSFPTSGAKELVRLKFTATGDTEGLAAWIHFRANPIIWQPN